MKKQTNEEFWAWARTLSFRKRADLVNARRREMKRGEVYVGCDRSTREDIYVGVGGIACIPDDGYGKPGLYRVWNRYDPFGSRSPPKVLARDVTLDVALQYVAGLRA